MGNRHACSLALRLELHLDLNRTIGLGRNIDVERQASSRVPGEQPSDFDRAAIRSSLNEPAALENVRGTQRITGVAMLARPPLVDPGREEIKRLKRCQEQQDRLHHQGSDNAFRRPSAVSQKPSMNSRNDVKPCKRTA